ncbi:hypothetical protein FKW77_005483 [Venturia effusa]|uniref:Uncharacterized protein n=1 Tax=Venturia effusa TaxID=50376 RepID=A0A517KWD5_9PEZI|nr:hypothetical protein FKW77_005483 [Venturia effusa]
MVDPAKAAAREQAPKAAAQTSTSDPVGGAALRLHPHPNHLNSMTYSKLRAQGLNPFYAAEGTFEGDESPLDPLLDWAEEDGEEDEERRAYEVGQSTKFEKLASTSKASRH